VSINASTPTDPVTATIRQVSHDVVSNKTVKYEVLRPLASPRPTHMRTDAGSPEHHEVGKFVFFKRHGSSQVLSGVIATTNSDGLTVHEYRQSPKMERRFYAMYLNTLDGKEESKLKPHSHHTPLMHDMQHDEVMLTGNIDKNHIPECMLDALKAMGVV